MHPLIPYLLACFFLLIDPVAAQTLASATPRLRSPEYAQVQQRLGRGWNTWDVQSVTTHVLLPEGLCVRVGLLNRQWISGESFLPTALIGRFGEGVEQVFPGPHTYDGSYTDLKLTWSDRSFRIQSATDSGDLVLLVTPMTPVTSASPPPATVVFSLGFLWNRSGSFTRQPDRIEAHSGARSIPIFLDGENINAFNAPVDGPYFAANLDRVVALSSGKRRTVQQVRSILERQLASYDKSNRMSGGDASIAGAIQTVIGWDSTYDPEYNRVVSTISRVWSTSWGGWVLADWDTFFAASMASIGNRDLAHANVMEILNETTAAGFVPNFARPGGMKSEDRSEPPVGAITVLGIYERFHEQWFLRDTFPRLLEWNRWWAAHRDVNGYLVWGSDVHSEQEKIFDNTRGTLQGARFESGLDNSPMYDDVPFDQKTQRMMLADVGLMSMYIADCDALASIAKVLGRTAEERELGARAARYRTSLMTLWDEKTGIFLNKNLITGELSPHLSPTNFYPMLATVATPRQADRMVREHLLNPAEFNGQYVLPSIARNDPGYKDQDYWRGRVWGPMNYLVYLGLRNYDQPEARRQLAEKSLNLFLQEWNGKGHVHENYNANTGDGDDVKNSDRFYHWGALLGLISFMEKAEPSPHVP